MLSKYTIEQIAEALLEIYNRIESELLLNIASKFSVKDTKPISGMTAWQAEKLYQLGAINEENIKIIAKYAKRTQEEVAAVFEAAGYKAVEYDETIYNKAFNKGLLPQKAVPLKASDSIKNIISTAIKNAENTLNLVNTTAVQSASSAFTDIVNKVYLETSIGVRSYTDAIKTAVRELADKGITGITYTRNGKTINYQVDTAVRRAILTSTSQTAGDIQLERAKEWGCNLVEVSSHAGARPSHAVWQGKVYSLNGATDKYEDFYTATGYGTITGLKGVNCSHEFYPFFEGISEQTYRPYDEKKNEQTYNNSQKQRYMEREIRKEKRRILAADAIGDEEGKLKAQALLKEKESNLQAFLKRTGRTQRAAREQVYGFDYQ